jgi:hypothetical protein
MNADAGVDPVVLLGVGQRGVQFLRAGTGADSQQRLDAGFAGALQHGFAVIRELGKIYVRVGIDEFHVI